MENFEVFRWNFLTSTNFDIGRSVSVLFLGLFTVLNHNFSFFFVALFGASPQTGSWVPGPGSETQDPEPGTQDPISVPKVDKSF